MKQELKDYFTFSRSERRGTVLIASLICLVLVIRFIYPVFIRHDRFPVNTFEKEIAAWKRSAPDAEKPPETGFSSGKANLRLFVFDPNTISEDELEMLGIQKNIRKAWIGFRKSGYLFRKDSDLLKVYGMNGEIFAALKPFIRITEAETTVGIHPANLFQSIEINTATKQQLEGIRGIGPVLSDRVIRYRRLLGGFYGVFQLNEVYGLSDSLFSEIENRFSCDTMVIRKINLNTAGVRSLSNHPYLTSYDARAIADYRKKTGRILEIKELKNNKIIPDSTYRKIFMYLTISSDEK